MIDKVSFLKDFMDNIWNKQQFDMVEKYVHPEYTIRLDNADPWEGQTISHAIFKERLKFSFNSFPDMNFEVAASIGDGNNVAITWILTGTHLGNIGDIGPTKKAINAAGMTIYHFKDDLICGHTQVLDRTTVMKQLGFM